MSDAIHTRRFKRLPKIWSLKYVYRPSPPESEDYLPCKKSSMWRSMRSNMARPELKGGFFTTDLQ